MFHYANFRVLLMCKLVQGCCFWDSSKCIQASIYIFTPVPFLLRQLKRPAVKNSHGYFVKYSLTISFNVIIIFIKKTIAELHSHFIICIHIKKLVFLLLLTNHIKLQCSS